MLGCFVYLIVLEFELRTSRPLCSGYFGDGVLYIIRAGLKPQLSQVARITGIRCSSKYLFSVV
jgi:hypothetical protein